MTATADPPAEADPSAPHEHRGYAPQTVACVILTVSDSRTPETDTAGRLIEEGLRAGGHRVVERALVPDDPERVRELLEPWLGRAEVDAVIVTGGTGAAPRDRTPEAVESLFDRTLPGFGELFRMLSFEEVGAAAMLSRATAGVARGKAVFLLPGSRGAVRLAVERLILPELAHLVGQLRR